MKTDYAKLDAAILAAIKAAGRIAFHQINQRCSKEAREAYAGRPEGVIFRAVDRRLQALRKAGKIKHDTGCWSMAA